MASKSQDVISNFYKLKRKYEKQRIASKSRILKSDLSLRDKMIRLKRLKYKCIGCKRSVGTIFSIINNGRNLIAKCGSEEKPCGLDINIERGEYAYIPTLIKSLKIDLENNKTSIMRLKLDILFSLTTEEVISDHFEELKKKYKEYEKILSTLNSILEENKLSSVSEMGAERKMEKSEIIDSKKAELRRHITEIRELIKEYLRDKGASSQTDLESAIESYIDNIIPILDSIRENMYEIYEVLPQKHLFRLVQIKTKLNKLELVITKPKVISYVIKGK